MSGKIGYVQKSFSGFPSFCLYVLYNHCVNFNLNLSLCVILSRESGAKLYFTYRCKPHKKLTNRVLMPHNAQLLHSLNHSFSKYLLKSEPNKCNSLVIKVFVYHPSTSKFMFSITKSVKIPRSAKINLESRNFNLFSFVLYPNTRLFIQVIKTERKQIFIRVVVIFW